MGIADVFGLPALPESSKELVLVANNNDGTEKVGEDFEKSRDSILQTMTDVQKAISDAISIAEQSQHPRMYEILANLFKTNLEASKDLLEVHKKIRDIKKSEGAAKGGDKNVTNNILVATSNEILELIQQQIKK